jgi:hypothetical protein
MDVVYIDHKIYVVDVCPGGESEGRVTKYETELEEPESINKIVLVVLEHFYINITRIHPKHLHCKLELLTKINQGIENLRKEIYHDERI